MPNDFSEEEVVAWEQILMGFEDQLVMSRNVTKYRTDDTTMARTGDVIWRPVEYIMTSEDGMDQSTTGFKNKTQLAVPATISFEKNSSWTMDAKELRDAQQEGRLGRAAYKKLASDVNIALLNIASYHGSLVVPITGAATGYDDVAKIEEVMNSQGIYYDDRYLALSTKDYNGMAGNLAARETLNGKALKAYEKSYVGQIASFETYKLDYTRALGAAGGGVTTMDTQDAATQYYVPTAKSTAVTGEKSNVDNRFQVITVDNSAGIVAGDAFTVAGIEAVHQITKESTGELKTFRVIDVPGGGVTLTITPPMITAQIASPAESEKQYKNCVNTTQSATAAFTWLNVNATRMNPFWSYDAIEILPGSYAVPADAGAAVMRATLENGLEVVFQKWYDIKSMETLFRVDVLFGVVNKAPEQSGIIIFNQP
jgi:hypothetical protein